MAGRIGGFSGGFAGARIRHLPFVEAAEVYGLGIAEAQACMRGWELWPEQRVEDGLRVVACPLMGEMAVSPRYGHPVGGAQARRELVEKS